MKLGHIEIFVSDPLKSKDFYVDVLGFEVVAVQQKRFVWLRRDDREVLLRPGRAAAAASSYAGAAITLVLYTDDLPRTKRDLEARGLVFRGTDGTDRCPTFTDPDGNWFQLVNPNDH
jgi:catechol 2,3-dioxygenase-like lactoylglutathione lyase family enzyme